MDKPTDWRSGTRRIFSNELDLPLYFQTSVIT